MMQDRIEAYAAMSAAIAADQANWEYHHAKQLSASQYRRKLIQAGLLKPSRFYLKRRGGMIFWRCGMIGGSFFLSHGRR